ncbi:hypothetical protein DICSQDRAFT_172899 [Dichomitus squalens LYAD-421 SS1]|uniref:UvrD-like helicase ATP-binding domain-containing protein n=1 Tax=Dichomitus squalens (strain LYAD-421) TaxID=732165 RepID=R7SQT4_DICSQ|nr:uncharacterized protein DICSQDRAFT_172899 [Dichomitus squalens LYAD-421 SS1]EJF58549.1 hypothetical protein DICSQDRAFT_172899 [Dichomitus squalens LYAD-421 SS1]
MLDPPSPTRLKPPAAGGVSIVDAVPALFDRQLIDDQVAVEAVISATERHLIDIDSPGALDEALAHLERLPHLLEFVLSAVNDEVFRSLSATILQRFSKTSEGFSSSLAAKLLTRLPLFYLFLPSSSSPDISREALTVCRQQTEAAIRALEALSRLRFEAEEEPPLADELSEYADFLFAVKRKGQSKRKQARRAPRAPPVDVKAITSYCAEIPQTRAEVAQLCESILNDQRRYLGTYLEYLRLPSVQSAAKLAFLPPPTDLSDASTVPDVPEMDKNIVQVEEVEVPPAYPLVQPMKAALYFDSAEGFGEWRILISTRADRVLRHWRRRDAKLFQIFVKKIKELSNGHFSDDNQKRLTGLDVEIPIYEAKMTGDTRLVYQVDCVPEFESDVERQVLKIFGIYTHAQLDRRFWDCMGRHLERKGAEYKKRCTFRNPPVNPGDIVFTPASWPPPAENPVYEPVSAIADMRKEDYEELHSLLVLEKFVTFSQALLNSIIADKEVAHVFEITPQEKKIIEHPSSCYVLGRSGTGKTTTMLFKMLGIERAWEMHRDAMPKLRQLFVTQSRVLAEKVEEYFAKLLESLATAARSPAELKSLAARQKQQQEQGLVDRDEEICWRGDLPKRYGALKEEHFPMFLTYDHICRLLESEFSHIEQDVQKKAAVSRGIQDAFEVHEPGERDTALSNDYMQQRRTSFVSYGTFLEEYWLHFPQALTKGLDPSLVFGEFMGVIKGSELALERPEGHLSKDMYHGLSHRTQGTFANQRETVYKLYEAYLTHALITSLCANGVPGEEMDFIYVDEAQDNLLIDALVLRTLCRNPHGMFWAGDTAQTISVGSAFRFNDLKAFLYRVEEANAGENAEKRTQPESFHLAVNYRSHAGIVDCAHSVIELITQFWPHAIDALAPEQGMIHGLKPVFFSGWDQNTVRYEQFLFGEAGSHIEFGAEQCILVRDEAARDKLRAQVGDIGLIMTLYESKGLEFNDVLLYNFFEDSTVDLSQWRVVLNALPQEQRVDHPAPRFDDARHSGVCRELKFLYVAITRARKNLWIADGSEKADPMRIVWTKKDQIQNCTPGTDVPRLAMSSTAEDWAKTALSLFNNRRYMQAMHCYERAGLSRERAVANAYYLREVARTRPVIRGDNQSQTLAFLAAAEAFIASAREAVTEKKAYYRIAAQCYVDGGEDFKAAQAYALAAEYTLAAQHYRKAGKFEDAVDIIKVHRAEMQVEVVESIVDVSRLYFLREKQIKKAMELFDNDDEALEYMDDYGLDVARAQFLEDVGRYAEAADVHLSEGNTLEGIRVLTMDNNNEASMKRALDCLLDGLWRSLSYGVPVNELSLRSSGVIGKLLRYTNALGRTDAGDELLRDEFVARASSAAAFLCLDRVFSVPLKLQTATLSEIATKLETFYVYARLLQRLWSVNNPCEDPDIRKVFALQPSTEDMFLLPKGTLLATEHNDRLTPSAREMEQGTLVPRWELEKLVKHVLKVRLLKRVKEENDMCYSLRPLQPCLTHVVFRQCNRADCLRDHVETERYDATSYNTRIRTHILQILIFQTLYAIENHHEHARHQRYWLRRLYEVLNPPYYKLGSSQLLSPALIPEFSLGSQVIKVWVRDNLYALDPYRPANAFLTSLLQGLRLAFRFDPDAASEYVHRIPAVVSYRPPTLMRGGDSEGYMVHYLLGSMQNSDVKALSKGVLFMNHVLEKKVPIDIGVLSNFMDHLCGSLLIASRLRATATLHDLTLPKSWLLRLSPNIEALRIKDTQLVNIYQTQITQLLEPIYTGQDAAYLFFEGRDLSTVSHQIRALFFARICRNLCLWGYNTRTSVHTVRNSIWQAIAAIRRPGRVFNPIVEEYVAAKSWDQLARVVRRSVKDSNLDEMVQLHYGGKPVERKSLFNVRRILYDRLEDIPWLLRTDGSGAASIGLRADAPSFVPAVAARSTVQPEEEDQEEPPAEDGENDVPEQVVDVEHVAQAIDADYATAAPTAPTAKDIAAATTIAEAYQRYIAKKRVKRRSSEETRRRIFATFSAQAGKMDWPHRYYRMLFLDPIPHLYMAVESLKNHLYEARNTARKRFVVAKHLELESMQLSLTQLTRSFKNAPKLHEALSPASELHQTRDLEKLKAYASEAEALMRSLPMAATLSWESDMKIALRGIVEVAKAPLKQPKPDLNAEGLDEY